MIKNTSLIGNDLLGNNGQFALEKALLNTKNILRSLSSSENRSTIAHKAFGNNFNAEKLDELTGQWSSNNFDSLPTIEIRSSEELNGANGAFAKETNTIYLSQEYIINNVLNHQAITNVLLEEIGHFVDSRINSSDAPGDEGAIFSSLVRGVNLSEQQLQSLKIDDDSANITLDNKTFSIERSASLSLKETIHPNLLAHTAKINVTYKGFDANPQARAAFQYAVDIWETLIVSPMTVPIEIDAEWKKLAATTLGSASPTTFFQDFSGIPVKNTYYPSALANSLAGKDLSAGKSDITVKFNSDFTWYYGTDGKTPTGQYDFVSVVLHEIGHGLGFSDSFNFNADKKGSWGNNGTPVIFDRFVVNDKSQSPIDTSLFKNNSVELGTQLTSGNVFFNGSKTVAANGGNAPLYAPKPWNGGSSISHLDQSYNRTINDLMTFSLDKTDAVHQPGPIAFAMFQDMGWNMNTNGWIYGTRADNTLNGSAINQRLYGWDGIDPIDAGDGADFADGGNGNDIVNGEAGNDTIYGGNNEDLLDGGEDDDILFGGNGNDTLNSGKGNDTIDGGAGTDTVSYKNDPSRVTVPNGVIVNLLTNLATDGFGGTDQLCNIENVIGSAFDDNITGDAQNNKIEAGSGNDNIKAGSGNDNIDGGEGIDTVDYSLSPNRVLVNIDETRGYADFGIGAGEALDGYGFRDTLKNLENITGSNSSDTLIGNNQNNSISGGFGDDVLIGNAGNDALDGGDAGSDTVNYLYDPSAVSVDLENNRANDGFGNLDSLSNIENVIGSNFNDRIIGDVNANIITGKNGNDVIEARGGDDTVFGGNDDDVIRGEQGNDSLVGDSGKDNLDGGNDDDNLSGGADDDILAGGTGDDSLFGNSGKDNLDGGEGNDTLSGGTEADLLTGGKGDDSLLGDDGNDTLIGEAGNDFIDGGNNVDTVDYSLSVSGVIVNIDEKKKYQNSLGGIHISVVTSKPIPTDSEPKFEIEKGKAKDGYDTVDTLKNLENIVGSNFDDVLIGNEFNNKIEALAGDDVLVGNAGNDTLNGGAGSDTASYRRDPGSVNINLEKGEAIDGFGGKDKLISIENFTGSAGNDTIIGNSQANIIFAESGNDVIEARGGDDIVFGGNGLDIIKGEAGNDFLVGGKDADYLDGGTGRDTASYFTSSAGVNVSLVTGRGSGGDAQNDTLKGIENLEGSEYNDLLTGDTKNNILSGLGGKDTLFGGKGLDSLYGGTGKDLLYGEADRDLLKGDDGDDIIVGGTGSDTIFGGKGNDTLIGGNATVFTNAIDELTALAVTPFDLGRDVFVFTKDDSFQAPEIVSKEIKDFFGNVILTTTEKKPNIDVIEGFDVRNDIIELRFDFSQTLIKSTSQYNDFEYAMTQGLQSAFFQTGSDTYIGSRQNLGNGLGSIGTGNNQSFVVLKNVNIDDLGQNNFRFIDTDSIA
ncbi:MAG: hypothetical protein ACRC11_16860 [Xenococcaceae cyanobacterium]